MTRFDSEYGREMGQRAWACRCANRPYPPGAIANYAYDAMLTPAQQRSLTRELARVAATEGEPARENFRRRARLYPHLTPALPAEKREVAA